MPKDPQSKRDRDKPNRWNRRANIARLTYYLILAWKVLDK